MTRRDICATARQEIAAAITTDQAIRAGLRIAACRMLSRDTATADGCEQAAREIGCRLESLYRDTGGGTIEVRLSSMVRRRDWAGLWQAARREVYPHIAA